MKKLLLTTILALTLVSTSSVKACQEESYPTGLDPRIITAYNDAMVTPAAFLDQYFPEYKTMSTLEQQDFVKCQIAQRVSELGSFKTLVSCCNYILSLYVPDWINQALTQNYYQGGYSSREERISLLKSFGEKKFAGVSIKDLTGYLVSLSATNVLLMEQYIESKFSNLQELVNWARENDVTDQKYFCEQKIQFLKDSLNSAELSLEFKNYLGQKLDKYQLELEEINIDSLKISVPILQLLMLVCSVKQVVDQPPCNASLQSALDNTATT